MHSWTRRTALAGASIAALSLTGFATQTASAAAPTQKVIVRPVTAAGQPVAGYKVIEIADTDPVICGGQSQSSLSPQVFECGTTADGGFACLQAADPHSVFCLDDASKHVLRELTVKGKVHPASGPLFGGTDPMNIRLDNGTRCLIREGGADGTMLKGHPRYAPLYYCDHHTSVWGKVTTHFFGVDKSRPTWTVQTAPKSGDGPLVTRNITTAYFVGPATS